MCVATFTSDLPQLHDTRDCRNVKGKNAETIHLVSKGLNIRSGLYPGQAHADTCHSTPALQWIYCQYTEGQRKAAITTNFDLLRRGVTYQSETQGNTKWQGWALHTLQVSWTMTETLFHIYIPPWDLSVINIVVSHQSPLQAPSSSNS